MVISRLERARAKTVRGALGSALLVTAVMGIAGGGAFAASPPSPTPVVQPPAPFWLADAAGSVWSFGGAGKFSGAAPAGGPQPSPVVAIAATPSGDGYWLLTSAGAVLAEGGARSYGSGGAGPGRPAADIASTADGLGYWVVSAAGSVYTFGDAHYFGSLTTGLPAQPIVRLVPAPDGGGYWLLSQSGQVFGFGDAKLWAPGAGSSPAAASAPGPIVDMAPTPDNLGYWLLSADGSVYNFGDASYAGDAPVPTGGDPAENIVPSPGGAGYWVVDQNGAATALGDAAGPPPVQALLFSPVTPGDRAVLFALGQLGKPYVWGASGPRGYDCSGLAYRSWFEATGVYIPRIASAQYHGAGPPVAWSGLQAGDLVFWGTHPGTWQSIYHTAIYVGGGQIVEAAGKAVQLNTLNQWGGSGLMGHGVRP